jgi:hypothetical protein
MLLTFLGFIKENEQAVNGLRCASTSQPPSPKVRHAGEPQVLTDQPFGANGGRTDQITIVSYRIVSYHLLSHTHHFKSNHIVSLPGIL